MILVQIHLSETIISLIEEKAMIAEKLRHVKELERLLAKAERRLGVERVAMVNLLAEVADKDQTLKATVAQEVELVVQVEDLRKHLNLLKV